MRGNASGGSLGDLAGFVYSVGLVGFALIGMGGVVYHCLAPAGVFAPWLGRLWSDYPVVALLISTALVGFVLGVRGQVSTTRPGRGSNDAPLYIFVTLGTFFASRLVVNGSL
jgi:hypothetical protein